MGQLLELYGAKLTPRGLHVLRLRYGLDYPKSTLRAVGAIFGVTAEAVRLRQKVVLRKLRPIFRSRAKLAEAMRWEE